MYHFFVEEEQVNGENAYISGSDVNHIVNVLRMKIGEELLISVKGDWDYLCKIEEIERNVSHICVRHLPIGKEKKTKKPACD